MMRRPTGHKEKYSVKSEISRIDRNDGTAARTRAFSFDEIMLGRKNRNQSKSVKDQGAVSERVYNFKESDRYRRRDIVDGSEKHASKEQLKVVSRTKEKIVESEFKESYSTHRRSRVDDDSAKDSRKERGVHEKRKNQDRAADDFDHEHGKRHSKDYPVKDRDRGKFEHVSKRSHNVYDDIGKKHESRKWHDPTTSEKKERKSTKESRPEDLQSRSKRSRSREHERDKSKRSKSPSPRGQKQRYYDAQGPGEPSSQSLKDVKKVSNNGSDNKIKKHDTSSSRLGGYSPRKRRAEAGWDSSPPVKMESSLPSLIKTEPSNSSLPITPSIPLPNFGVISSIASTLNVSVDSVQLTQATRPKRRIYVENLPSSASEAAVMQWLTGYLRPFGLTSIQSTSPCISCIVNKEKGQALVEFLTPEDASAALNFDGKSFSGNIVKIRRPKDYVEAKASTGVSEKPVDAAVPVKNIVQDSPNKIFIGGISKIITSEMLMEIVSAFGPLKAYRFEDNAHLHSPCAFLEYADQSVTVKACVGLNGMKLGGQVLTVTPATPDASLVGDHGDRPFYGTPVHARPLLEKPTQVLKLNNLVDPHGLPSLSESELEEILEDIRLECTRFGVVKSVNIIKQPNIPTSSETVKLSQEATPVPDEVTKEANPMTEEPVNDYNSHDEPENVNVTDGIVGNNHENKMEKDETCDDIETENSLIKADSRDTMENISDLIDAFEMGCVLVEYKRTEACSMAAHCLHGRVFDGRSVSVEYVDYDIYRTKFQK